MNGVAEKPRTESRAGTRHQNLNAVQTVIRANPDCRLIPVLSAEDFIGIEGVYNAYADGKNIRIIFDGMQDTITRLAEYLSECKKTPRCDSPCNRGWFSA